MRILGSLAVTAEKIIVRLGRSSLEKIKTVE